VRRRGSRTGSVASRLLLVLLAAGSAAGCTGASGSHAPPAEWSDTRIVHGVEIVVAVRHPDETAARAAIATALSAAEEIGGRLLAGVRGSEIDILVHVPSHVWVEISGTTYEALSQAFEVAEATDGAYDPTWPPLLDLWGLAHGDVPHVPRDFEIDMMLRRVDWTNVEVTDEEGLQARRLGMRTQIDLGGLARGAMLDAAVAQLRLAGMAAGRASTRDEHALFGGTRAQPWRIPLPEGNALLREGALAVAQRGAPIETASGDTIYARFDPRTGRPAAASRWAAVATARASTAAAYADAVFAMGAEGRAFVKDRRELLGAIENDDGILWVSRGLDVQ